jgi:hypothetical protein
MKGSGIYSEDVTREVECGECSKAWEFETISVLQAVSQNVGADAFNAAGNPIETKHGQTLAGVAAVQPVHDEIGRLVAGRAHQDAAARFYDERFDDTSDKGGRFACAGWSPQNRRADA